MLEFKEFLEHVRDNIKDHLPEEFEDAEVSIQTVTKNNGKELNAVCIRRPDVKISPNIYLESFYENYKENGMALDVVLERIAQIEMEHIEPGHEIEDFAEQFTNPEFIRDRVVVSIINAEKNEELLKTVPHKFTEDLAIIYKVYVGEAADGIGSVTVTNDHMNKWGFTPDELHEMAMENSKNLMPAKVEDMAAMLSGILGDMDEELPLVAEDKSMYVISNKQRVNGAASILYSDALAMLSERLHSDLYILPSSIHETIAVSTSVGEANMLAEMVREVNRTEVKPEERLSDHVYKYDAETRTITIADDLADSREISQVSEEGANYEAAQSEAVRPRHHR